MRLKNVTASEVFNAMNIVFETENTPLRWELRMNGNRPAAVLYVLPDLLPRVVQEPPGACCRAHDWNDGLDDLTN